MSEKTDSPPTTVRVHNLDQTVTSVAVMGDSGGGEIAAGTAFLARDLECSSRRRPGWGLGLAGVRLGVG
ncbi:alpha/beta hydrolase [Rhodococcus erythropolis]|uniref:alpha/beta hydrolase n=1 Tax=Rhodococcus erythropolis TaxID=1833 RepID=UPI001F45DE1D|nr:alpha/beta hydrolase [Rhodococcus erythropolis]